MTEVSSIVSLDRDGAGRPTCLRAMTEGDTISDSVLSQNVNTAVSAVNVSADEWNEVYQVVESYSGAWTAAAGGTVGDLDDILNVNTTTATTDQTIVYDGTFWNNVDYSLSALSDTNITSLASRNILMFVGGKWKNIAPNLNDLSDVAINTPSNNQVITYDNVANKWTNRGISTVINNANVPHSVLDGVGTNTHAQIDSHITGVVNASNGWQAGYTHSIVTGTNPHLTKLSGITDVSIPSTPTNGYVLTWTGSYWSAVAPTGGGATGLDDLTDVVITTPNPYEALIFTSTGSWINSPISHTWLNGTGTNTHTQIDSHITGVVNASANWQTGYTHVSVTGNPHSTYLTDLDDVQIASTPTNYQGLIYFTSIDKWDNSEINHIWLNSTGTNTHSQIDSHISNSNNPHSVTASQVGNTIAQWNASSLQGTLIKTGIPVNKDILLYNGTTSQWEGTNISNVIGSTSRNLSDGFTLQGNNGIAITSVGNTNFIVVSGNTISQWDASALRGTALSSTLIPTANQSLVYDGSVWTASSVVTGGGGVTDHGALTGLADDDHPQYVLSATNDALSSLVNNHIASAVHWDIATLNSNYINASGDSANAAFFFQTLSATTVSATTYLNIRPNVSSVNSAATTSFTAGGDYDTYLINTTTTSVIAYLPEASSYTNKIITFSKVDDGGSYRSVTVSGAQLVTATNTVILYDPTESVTVISNGTNWYSLDYDRSYGVVFVCKNSTGATLTKGTPVRVSGATGANVLITPASAVNNAVPESPSGFLARVIGVVEHDIPNGEFGHVLTKGSLYKYNTNAFNEGDALFLAASGGLTNIKPTPPYEEIFIGIVTRKQTNNGSILVDIQNPEHINSIVGFNLASSISERDVIAYDLTTSTFKNYNPSSFNVSSATSATNAFSATNALSSTSAFSATNAFSSTNALSATSALNASRAPAGFTVTGTLLATNISATNFSGIDHDTDILNVGTYTHAAIDVHITDTANPHSVTAEQVGNSTAQWNASALQDIEVKPSFPNDRDILIYSSPFNQWAAGSLLATDVGNTTAQWNASAIRSSPLSSTLVPTTGQSLVYNGSVWTASTVVATGGGGGGISDASSLRGSPLSATLVPTAGQALMYNGSVWTASAALFAYSYGSGAPTGGSDGDIYLQTDVEALQVATVSATTYLNLPSSVITWTNATSATNAFSSTYAFSATNALSSTNAFSSTYAFSATNALSSTNAFSSTYALSATSALNAQQAPNGFTVTGTATATTASSTNLLTLSGDVSSTRLTDYSERIVTFTITTSAITLDLNTAQVFSGTLNSNISSVTISNPDPRSNTAQGFTMLLMADGTARTITWPAAVKWPAGTGPTLTSTNGKVDILSFFSPNNGTTWYGFIGGQNF